MLDKLVTLFLLCFITNNILTVLSNWFEDVGWDIIYFAIYVVALILTVCVALGVWA